MKRLLTIVLVTSIVFGLWFGYLWFQDKKAAEEIVDNGAELNSAGIRDIRAEIASWQALSGENLSWDIASGSLASGGVLSWDVLSWGILPPVSWGVMTWSTWIAQ